MWGLVNTEDPPRGTLLWPRSYCPHCRKQISAWRLIPVASYLLQSGRCADCNGEISIRYPVIELAGIFAAAIAFGLFGLSLTAFFAAMLGWFMIALIGIDWETCYLPDWLTLPLLAIGLTANVTGRFATLPDAMIGAAVGYIVFRFIAAAFMRIRGYEGLGQGDAKTLAAIGAWGGWQILPAVVFSGAVATLLIVLLLRLMKRPVNATTPIPFGPGLCIAGYAAILIKQFIT